MDDLDANFPSVNVIFEEYTARVYADTLLKQHSCLAQCRLPLGENILMTTAISRATLRNMRISRIKQSVGDCDSLLMLHGERIPKAFQLKLSIRLIATAEA